MQHGVRIVPFAMLGGDEAWRIVWDARELSESPLGGLIRAGYDSLRIPWDSMMPLAAGVGATPLPRPVGLYFSFGEPIEIAPWAGRQDDDPACYALRAQVAQAIYGQLDFLAGERKWDPRAKPSFRRRLTDRLIPQSVGEEELELEVGGVVEGFDAGDARVPRRGAASVGARAGHGACDGVGVGGPVFENVDAVIELDEVCPQDVGHGVQEVGHALAHEARIAVGHAPGVVDDDGEIDAGVRRRHVLDHDAGGDRARAVAEVDGEVGSGEVRAGVAIGVGDGDPERPGAVAVGVLAHVA
jgi:hypothetical protein